MLAAAGAGATAIGAAGAYLYRARGVDHAGNDMDEEPEVLDMPISSDDKPVVNVSWKSSSGRASGREGYVFGDMTRGIICRTFGKATSTTEDSAAEAAGDAQYSQVQKLVREAIKLYRARGYNGSISMSQNVAYFNESVSVNVKGPAEGDLLPWEKTKNNDPAKARSAQCVALSDEKLAAEVAEDAIAFALDAEVGSASSAALAKDSEAGYVFATLIARLERRAKSWDALKSDGVDPNLTQSAHIGFAIPIVRVGWGVSISLQVSASSLVRWTEHEAAIAVA